MIRIVFQSLGAFIAGVLLAGVGLTLTEVVSEVFHPFPPGVDRHNLAVCWAHVANYPQWLLGVCGLCWGVTAFFSTFLTTRLSPKNHFIPGLLVGMLFLLAALYNLALLPYPSWFQTLASLLLVLGFYFGIDLAGGIKRTPPPGMEEMVNEETR